MPKHPEQPDYRHLTEMRVGEPLLQQPLEILVAESEALLSRDFFRTAARSELYRRLWRPAGVRVSSLEGRSGLQNLPMLQSQDLQAMLASGKNIRKALLARPRTWVISAGRQDSPKWLPVTGRDVAHWYLRMRRLYEQIGQADQPTVVLALNEPMPRPSNAIPYLWEQADYLNGNQQLEWIVAAMQMLPRVHWDSFVRQKQPNWLVSSVHDARQMAAAFEQLTGGPVHQVLPGLERGFFWGAPLDDSTRTELVEQFGLAAAHSLYFSAGCREMYFECRQQNGLHLWMDGVIHEIIPQGEHRACFIDQVQPGTRGEYVVTVFYEALPLIRYRTGDQIELVSKQGCSCGINHPLVRFTGRIATIPVEGI
ncbi:MAG: hypothetical protein JW862_11755 [Anaerolineales bacterium]|nr:hypothetical protein [Anaerolineales bacterium]